jgi:rhamnose utilization protein RhaD (predicted bifunctional aldolase and dehydrogenase)
LASLVEMTRILGQPEMNYVIVGEGNTSFRIDSECFWVKASGQGMHSISADGFVALRFAPLLEALNNATDDPHRAMSAAMDAAKVDSAVRANPSVEATFHAALLYDCGVRCIAHTHPLLINQIMCSTRAEEFATIRMFPDQVVLCGPRSVFVPYVDPGLPLALAIRERVRAYMDEYGEFPRVVLLANHGLIALGQTPKDALNVTAMAVKAAGIFMGACSIGQPTIMTEADIHHIYKRPDEIYRRKLFQ